MALMLERDCMKRGVSKLRLEVEQLQAVSICLVEKSVGEGWISVRRKNLAPITTEVVRAQTVSRKVGVGKENMCKRDLNCLSTRRIVPVIVTRLLGDLQSLVVVMLKQKI